MVTLVKTAKVSSKGQITLPRDVRDALKSDLVRIVLEDGNVRIEPLHGLGGSLKAYAKRFVEHKKGREQAWTGVMRDKHGGR
jgi:bifunctional DNA-binding transcriptional regulator/antitoxin component of YhaV-PrlF toxin-antitoxin module